MGGGFGTFAGVEFAVAEFGGVDARGPVGLGGEDQHPFFALRFFGCFPGGDVCFEVLLAL